MMSLEELREPERTCISTVLPKKVFPLVVTADPPSTTIPPGVAAPLALRFLKVFPLTATVALDVT